MNFWKTLKKPFFVLAPMADVTDPPFRHIIAKYGKPDVMYTQFVSADGLTSEGYEMLVRDLAFTEQERPIVAQFFGAKPENFYTCAKLAQKLGFDGIDINMGCPDKNVLKQGAGAGLIKDYKLAQEIVVATKEGAGPLPVAVKTRVGDTKNEIATWVPNLLTVKPAVIIMHARTRKQLSKVPANWDYVRETVLLAKGSETLIVGNGDVATLDEGFMRAEETGADGIMYGRAIFGNPWFFNRNLNREAIPLSERLQVMMEHADAFERMFTPKKNFSVMKKHFKAYVDGFSGAKELRSKLMATENADEVRVVTEKFIKTI